MKLALPAQGSLRAIAVTKTGSLRRTAALPS